MSKSPYFHRSGSSKIWKNAVDIGAVGTYTAGFNGLTHQSANKGQDY